MKIYIFPETMKTVERLKSNVSFISELHAKEEPMEIELRTRQVFNLFYGFSDASGTGCWECDGVKNKS